VDLTLRNGVCLKEAIQMAKDIDQQSKQSGFNQHALDQMARQGFANAQFEMNSEEGLNFVEEFYTDENDDVDHSQQQVQAESKIRTRAKPKRHQGDGFVQEMQQGLQGSVRAVN